MEDEAIPRQCLHVPLGLEALAAPVSAVVSKALRAEVVVVAASEAAVAVVSVEVIWDLEETETASAVPLLARVDTTGGMAIAASLVGTTLGAVAAHMTTDATVAETEAETEAVMEAVMAAVSVTATTDERAATWSPSADGREVGIATGITTDPETTTTEREVMKAATRTRGSFVGTNFLDKSFSLVFKSLLFLIGPICLWVRQPAINSQRYTHNTPDQKVNIFTLGTTVIEAWKGMPTRV